MIVILSTPSRTPTHDDVERTRASESLLNNLIADLFLLFRFAAILWKLATSTYCYIEKIAMPRPRKFQQQWPCCGRPVDRLTFRLPRRAFPYIVHTMQCSLYPCFRLYVAVSQLKSLLKAQKYDPRSGSRKTGSKINDQTNIIIVGAPFTYALAANLPTERTTMPPEN